MNRVNFTREREVSGSLTLKDLRDLVEDTNDWPEGSKVKVKGYKAVDQRDYDQDTIKVVWDEREVSRTNRSGNVR